MSIRRHFITTRPRILDRRFPNRRKAMHRNLHYSVEEFPINAEVESRRFFPVAHSEQHTSAFTMKIETSAEIDHERPPRRRLWEWFCRPNEAPQGNDRNVNAGQPTDRRGVGSCRIHYDGR